MYIKGNCNKQIATVAVFLCLAGLAGSGAVGATAVSGAAESVAAQSIQVRTTNSKNVVRRGQYSEAWRRMGLRVLKQEVKRELQEQECAAHSYGQVHEFFLRTPCRSLQRTLLAVGDGQGNTVVVSIAWVRMRNTTSAERLKRLVDTNGTGNVYPIASEALELRGVQFNGQHYVSRRTGSLVVIAEAAPGSGRPGNEVLDGAAEVAAEFPPP